MEAVLPISTKKKKKRTFSTHTLRTIECVRFRKTKNNNTHTRAVQTEVDLEQTSKQANKEKSKKKNKSEVLIPVVVFHDYTPFFFLRWNTLHYTLTNSVKLLRNVNKNKTIKHTWFFFGSVA